MRLLDLIESDTHLKRYSNRHGGEYRGACPKCGGDDKSDRFIVWPEDGKGHFWCRQCRIGGDDVSYLVKVRGLSMPAALRQAGRELTETDRQRAERKRAAREKVLTRFFTWKHEKLRAFRELQSELEIAETAYRAIVRRPDLWPEDEQDYWITYLGDLYFAVPIAIEDTDRLVVDPQFAWTWWRKEEAV